MPPNIEYLDALQSAKYANIRHAVLYSIACDVIAEEDAIKIVAFMHNPNVDGNDELDLVIIAVVEETAHSSIPDYCGQVLDRFEIEWDCSLTEWIANDDCTMRITTLVNLSFDASAITDGDREQQIGEAIGMINRLIHESALKFNGALANRIEVEDEFWHAM